MRGTFQRWLFFFVAVSFAALFLLTFYIQNREAYADSESHIETRLEDVQKQIKINEKNFVTVLGVYNNNLTNNIRTLAYFLKCRRRRLRPTPRRRILLRPRSPCPERLSKDQRPKRKRSQTTQAPDKTVFSYLLVISVIGLLRDLSSPGA